MIAVNGWDEERDVVAKFVQDQGLKQTVLLMGGTVAAQRYGVTSYPTTFVLDGEGVVVKYEVGFNPEMLEKMEKEFVELLEKQK